LGLLIQPNSRASIYVKVVLSKVMMHPLIDCSFVTSFFLIEFSIGHYYMSLLSKNKRCPLIIKVPSIFEEKEEEEKEEY
jgi:hypothetical protein